ncbi:MAG: YraN family protein [Actinomycetota bacterium]|nr:YraN family protein [Actinomycetota bacterium]MDZ4181061.1 YraN family protein [Coriobacteriia bacterium]
MSAADIGRRGEDAATAYLENAGMTVVERNWRDKSGEIDIVALDGETLVIVEVKTRRAITAGSPEESVSPTKQKRLTRLGRIYMERAGLSECDVRFDVVAILVLAEDRALLRHHRAAFAAS